MQVIEPYIEKFLTKAIKSKDYSILPLAGDASNRRYYRIIKDQHSSVLMRWEPFDPSNYPFLSVLNHFQTNSVQVPEVIELSPADGLVLLEDLGDLTLERKFWENQNQEYVIPFYQLAVDELIKIHYLATDRKNLDCTAFKIKFDTEKFLWEMNYGKENLIQGVLKYSLSDSVASELQGIFRDICTRLDVEPKRIAHRDYHSRNLMIKLGRMGVIDFQDARLGPIQYDLVSLLKDSYVDLSPNSSAQILDDYLEKAKPNLPKNFSREKFDLVYEIQSIQRCFKACGSFASFYHQRGDRRYLKYLLPTLKRVLQSLEAFPEYKLMANLIKDSGSLDTNYEALI